MTKRESHTRMETRKFFERPGQHVIDDIAFTWMRYKHETTLHNGKGSMLAILNKGKVRLCNIALATLYSDAATRKRFSDSRAPEIEALEPGTLICYNYRTTRLVFIKIQGAENIGLVELEEIDRNGNPISEQGEIRGRKIAKLMGLKDREMARLIPFSFHGKRGFKVIAEKDRESKLSRPDVRGVEHLILGK